MYFNILLDSFHVKCNFKALKKRKARKRAILFVTLVRYCLLLALSAGFFLSSACLFLFDRGLLLLSACLFLLGRGLLLSGAYLFLLGSCLLLLSRRFLLPYACLLLFNSRLLLCCYLFLTSDNLFLLG